MFSIKPAKLPEHLSEKRGRERFRRRKINLLKKAHEMKLMCEAEVYLVIHRNERYYVYNSSDCPQWPPPDDGLNKVYPVPTRFGPKDFETLSSPTQNTTELLKLTAPMNETEEKEECRSGKRARLPHLNIEKIRSDEATRNLRRSKVVLPPTLDVSPVIVRVDGRERA
ncbi:MAG: hypothetical protein M1834_004243 [Cirrosporium novae-zelandiae]|nr:MAG: hypothetical protein M1834_004243 [Cirrosporium novae-zelandiae]